MADRDRRLRAEMAQAERWMRGDPADRRRVGIAVVLALVVHAGVLGARIPDWGPDPVRLEAPQQRAMQVKFLKPPAPPKVERKPQPPKPKRIPRPDPTPDEPETEVAPEPPAPEEPQEAAPPQPAGPVRVAPGQGPGLIKRVEPQYPPIARAARLTGTVVLDAIIQKDGTVTDVKVIKSTNEMFERASIDAVRQWRAHPVPVRRRPDGQRHLRAEIRGTVTLIQGTVTLPTVPCGPTPSRAAETRHRARQPH